MSDFSITAEGTDKIVVTRSFAAPVADVLKAYLEPDLIVQWLGSPEMPMTTAEIDPRPGGSLRYGWTMPGGQKMWLTGTFTEMEMAANGDSRIVHTELFDPDWTGGMSIEAAHFTADGNRTRFRSVVTYPTPAARDAALASDMATGMEATYTRLDAVLAG